jgi:hypothetical protein
MPQLSNHPFAFQGDNPFLETDLPDSEAIYEPTPFGISALTNVDHLMDEVFQDLEQMLERGAVLPTDLHEEPAPPPVSPAAPLLMPSCLTSPPTSAAGAYLSAALANGQIPTHLPANPALMAQEPLVPLPNEAFAANQDLLNDPDLGDLMNLEEVTVPPRKSGNGGIVLSAVLATLLITGGMFATVKWRLYQMIPGMGTGVTEASLPEASQSGKDQQFLDYVGRSLNRIDRTATRTGGTAPGTLPSTVPGTLPGTIPPPPPDLLTVPSVVTIPPVVGTVPAAKPPVFGSFTSQPTPPRAVPGTVAAPVAPVRVAPARPPAAARTATAQTATAQTAAAPTTVPRTVPRTVPTLPVVVSPSPIAAAITPNLDPTETHALIGLLELGDRSAALLEVNGVPQRIQVGEKIGASGWQVVSITNQAALIQRNGEVRSIYVGQQF